MKKLFSLFLTILMVVFVFAGCGDNSQSSQISTSDKPIVSSPEDNSGGEENGDGNDNGDDADFFLKNGQGFLPEAQAIEGSLTETETEFLYSFDCDFITQNDENGFSAFSKDNLLNLFCVKSDDGEYYYDCYACISLESGQTLYELILPDWCSRGILDDGSLWVVEYPSLEVKFYDKSGNSTTVFQGISEDDSSPVDSFVTPDGKYMAVVYGEQKSLEIYNLQTGEKSIPDFAEDEIFWGFYSAGSNIALMGDYDGYIIYNPENDEHLRVETGNTFNFYDDLCSYHSDNALLLGAIDGSDERFCMPVDATAAVCDVKFGYATIHDNSDNSISFYNLRGVNCVDTVNFSNSNGLFSTILDSGRVLILNYNGNDIEPYIYDLPAAAKEYDGEYSEPLICTKAQMDEKIAQIAEEIYNDTGIEILYGSQGNDFVAVDYVSTAELDVYAIYSYITALEEVMSRYPEGMLREVHKDTHDGMKIYLCGDIYGIIDSSVDAAAGVTYEQGFDLVIALSVKGNVYHDLPHELSHAFDRRIDYVYYSSGESTTNWSAVWDEFTPFDDAYIYSYDNYWEYSDYCADDATVEDAWFISAYGRTYPTEDRACIMQQLFNYEGSGEKYFEHENLLDKARLYSYILRQCFPSCDTNETHYWETNIGEIVNPAA